MPFTLASSYSAIDVSQINSRCVGFTGAIFDGTHVYFCPTATESLVSLNAYPGPLATSMAASQAPNGFAVGSYAGITAAPNGGMIVAAAWVWDFIRAYDLNVNGTINAANLIVESSTGLRSAHVQ